MQLEHARCRFDEASLREPYGWILLSVDPAATPAAPVVRRLPVEAMGARIPYWALLFVDYHGFLDMVDVGRGDAVPMDRFPRPDEMIAIANTEPDPGYLSRRMGRASP
jgi:hypothetical protein